MATTLPPHLIGELDVLVIDNFDSFTWNLYQQLSLLGANVTVIRNDAISPELFPQLNIKHLIISPGPGHPKTDSGISNDAIRYFQGKVPILGVCMGLECIVDVYGGTIGYAGEIKHGKVSKIRHDNRGCFKDVPQGIACIRYHSLSASYSTIPADLAITSATEESGVIMGVRHRKYAIEAVQYHPESILSEGGDAYIRNFLSLQGGTWEENLESKVLDVSLPPFPMESLPKEIAADTKAAAKIPSILDKIYAQRLEDVKQAKATPGTSLEDLETLLALNVAPPLISFIDRLRDNQTGSPSLMAEIKRASPSKGPISLKTNPAKQALIYALSGAHTISVLTEPKWFLGSLQDMLHARLSIAHLPNRPAILRKDFILNRYQIIEARIWGADTVLLIVSMLPEPLLRQLYKYSLELGMEPLVEVNNAKEMEMALSLPAKVIGVNNRNLHNFDVDMETTTRLSDMVKGKEVTLCALSGIASAGDVQKYQKDGVGAVLIGESLMRAADPAAFIRELLSLPDPPPTSAWKDAAPLVKICGIQSTEEALAIAEAGADFLGLVFVPSSKRNIDLKTAREISQAIRNLRYKADEPTTPRFSISNSPWFTRHATLLSRAAPQHLLVGVFQNASLSKILEIVESVQLDLVQLHGSEPTEWANHIPVPVIRAFHIGDQTMVENITRGGAHQFILLDSVREDGLSGGSGKVVDFELTKRIVDEGEIKALQSRPPVGSVESSADIAEVRPEKHTSSSYPLPIILAGGLAPDNVVSAIETVRPWAVDVSGGVEDRDGKSKDLEKVRDFITKVKQTAVAVTVPSIGRD